MGAGKKKHFETSLGNKMSMLKGINCYFVEYSALELRDLNICLQSLRPVVSMTDSATLGTTPA
jgi:hypothetical protein